MLRAKKGRVWNVETRRAGMADEHPESRKGGILSRLAESG